MGGCFPLQCHLLFDSLQDLVDHVNDFHVKPEKDSGYCCHWEGCARKGRGFNARWEKILRAVMPVGVKLEINAELCATADTRC